jgi:predicted Rossmann fold nucleotide-binding protein DprA/Smf involved in DNA uptake
MPKTRADLESVIESLEKKYEKYCSQLEHIQLCKNLLKEVQGFSEEEMSKLHAAVERRAQRIEPIVAELTEEIIAAQEIWRNKEISIQSMAKILGKTEQQRWLDQHGALADRLDKLVELLK